MLGLRCCRAKRQVSCDKSTQTRQLQHDSQQTVTTFGVGNDIIPPIPRQRIQDPMHDASCRYIEQTSRRQWHRSWNRNGKKICYELLAIHTYLHVHTHDKIQQSTNLTWPRLTLTLYNIDNMVSVPCVLQHALADNVFLLLIPHLCAYVRDKTSGGIISRLEGDKTT